MKLRAGEGLGLGWEHVGLVPILNQEFIRRNCVFFCSLVYFVLEARQTKGTFG